MKKKIENFKIVKNEKIAKDVFLLELEGDVGNIKNAGQFVHIKITGKYLRRPISICNWTQTSIILIYKIMGSGTKILSEMKIGTILDIMYPLGNGFNATKTTKHTVLIGGGVGVPPLVGLTKKMIEKGKKPQVVLGFNTKEEVFGRELFEELGVTPIITTIDGSVGIKGLVTDALKNMHYDYVCTCGPEPMLKAIWNLNVTGQFSLETRMGCGFGACMGCTCETTTGYKRICLEGPVLLKEEIKW